jgi:hypothetical protein
MCNLTTDEKKLIIDCINATFGNGVKGSVADVAQTVAMATRIIQALSGTGPGQVSPPNGTGAKLREAVPVAQSEGS